MKTDKAGIDDIVMDALLDHRLFLADGRRFGSEQPGWFRIVFSHPRAYLEEGLRRLLTALKT